MELEALVRVAPELVALSGQLSSSRAGGSGLGSWRVGGLGPPPSTTSGGDVSMGAFPFFQ